MALLLLLFFRERNINVKEKDSLAASHTNPDLGLNPQTRYVSCQGIKLDTFWCTG